MRTTTAQGGSERGNTLVEAALATVLLGVSLFAVAGTMSSSLTTTSRSRQLNHEQEFDALLAMSGNVFLDRATPESSQHRIELTVSRVGVDRLDLVLVLRHQQTGTETARVATVRSRR
jgi:Tfp pilus assembly protein PilV